MAKKPNRFPAVMKSVAGISGVLTSALAVVYSVRPASWLLSAAITCGTIFYHFVMRLAVGTVVPLLTKPLRADRPWFRPRKFEPALYKALRVRHWKRTLPTYDPRQFDLTHNTPAQIIRNMCSAELVHEVIVLFSFVPLLLAIPFGELPVFLITSILAALYDGIFIVAQRYNRPRLARILQKKEVQP